MATPAVGGATIASDLRPRTSGLRPQASVPRTPDDQDRKPKVRYALDPGGTATAGARDLDRAPAEMLFAEGRPRLRVNGCGRRHSDRGAATVAGTDRSGTDSGLCLRRELVEDRRDGLAADPGKCGVEERSGPGAAESRNYGRSALNMWPAPAQRQSDIIMESTLQISSEGTVFRYADFRMPSFHGAKIDE